MVRSQLEVTKTFCSPRENSLQFDYLIQKMKQTHEFHEIIVCIWKIYLTFETQQQINSRNVGNNASITSNTSVVKDWL